MWAHLLEAVMLFNFRSPEYISDEYDSPTELSVDYSTCAVCSCCDHNWMLLPVNFASPVQDQVPVLWMGRLVAGGT